MAVQLRDAPVLEQAVKAGTLPPELARELRPEQCAALPLLLRGLPPKQVGPLVGRDWRTISWWLANDADFRTAYERGKAEVFECATLQAINVMDRQMSTEDELVSWRAANSTLQHHAQMARARSTVTHIHTVLDKLQAAVAGTDADAIDAEYAIKALDSANHTTGSDDDAQQP